MTVVEVAAGVAQLVDEECHAGFVAGAFAVGGAPERFAFGWGHRL